MNRDKLSKLEKLAGERAEASSPVSVIVADIKGDNYSISSEHLERAGISIAGLLEDEVEPGQYIAPKSLIEASLKERSLLITVLPSKYKLASSEDEIEP